jgi:FAD synthase
MKKIRAEKRFDGLDKLVSQIKLDCEQAKHYFSR